MPLPSRACSHMVHSIDLQLRHVISEALGGSLSAPSSNAEAKRELEEAPHAPHVVSCSSRQGWRNALDTCRSFVNGLGSFVPSRSKKTLYGRMSSTSMLGWDGTLHEPSLCLLRRRSGRPGVRSTKHRVLLVITSCLFGRGGGRTHAALSPVDLLRQ